MTYDPDRWAVLGQAIRDDRDRQRLTRKQLEARLLDDGIKVTTRTMATLEEGPWPKRGKRPSLEPVVRALGWKQGWTDRILNGEAPSDVIQRTDAEAPAPQPVEVFQVSPRERLSELAAGAYRFGGAALSLGVPKELCDEFEQLVKRIIDFTPAGQPSRSDYGTAAYRPHAEGEGVPADDAARIRDVLGDA